MSLRLKINNLKQEEAKPLLIKPGTSLFKNLLTQSYFSQWKI